MTSASNLLTERLSPWYALDGCRRGMPWTAVAIARARTDCILIPVGSYKAVRIRSLPIPIPNDQPIPDYFHEKLRSTNTSRAAMQCLRNASPSPGPRCSAWAARRDSASGTPRPAKGCATASQERLAQRSREARQCLGNSSPSQVPQATRQCLGNVVPTQDAVPRERLAQPRAARQCLGNPWPSQGL